MRLNIFFGVVLLLKYFICPEISQVLCFHTYFTHCVVCLRCWAASTSGSFQIKIFIWLAVNTICRRLRIRLILRAFFRKFCFVYFFLFGYISIECFWLPYENIFIEVCQVVNFPAAHRTLIISRIFWALRALLTRYIVEYKWRLTISTLGLVIWR